jgi:acylphosphatase
VSSVGVQLTIRGIVQGVGYRFYCCHKAKSLGLTGRVKNNPDGTVSVTAEGDRSLLEQLIKELRIGPPSSSVDGIDVTWTTYSGRFREFDLTF